MNAGTSRRRMVALVAALGGALALAAGAQAQAPIVIKFSHVVAADTPKGKASEFFAKRAGRAHQGQGQGRGLPEQPALQGQGRDGGAAARRGADAGAVAGQVRPARRQGVRGLRPALHLRRHGRAAQGHPGSGRQAVARQARRQGHQGPGVLGQRLQVVLGQQAAQDAGRLQGPEDAHPVVQGARGGDPRARRHAAGDGVLRGLPGAADRRRRRHREPASRTSTRRRCTRCRRT